ncbi:MAG: hypothetical protein P0Y64_04175 [Candidatus Sphingomonas colombiensis]|nr:hypothetical protein [Sphingomonas sp.]WEK44959.1 MAG: hypothetical protein P0Y64_04175 [Sphingomonas sp.]
MAYVTADAGLVVVDLADPLHPRLAAVRPLKDARASAMQFRYLWVTDAEGLKLFDVTRLSDPVAVPSATVRVRRRAAPLSGAHLCLCRGEGQRGWRSSTSPIRCRPGRSTAKETFGGRMTDVEDVIVGSTNASLFAYVADGRHGMKVIQLTSPASQPNFYGFSPAPKPELIAWARTRSHRRWRCRRGSSAIARSTRRAARSRSSAGIGSRPFTRPEMERLFLTRQGAPYKVSDEVDMTAWRPPLKVAAAR